MGADSDWNVDYHGFPLPNCVSFSPDRGWSLNCYGDGYPLSITRCRNSYDDSHCYPFPCNCKPYGDRYDNPFSRGGNSYDYGYVYSFSCSGNSYDYGYGYSFSCAGNSYCECNCDPFPCSGNSFSYDHCNPFPCSGNSYGYGYGYGYSLSFSCSRDPQYYQHTFTHCNRKPYPRCIIVGNTHGYLDVYPDSLSNSSVVSNSLPYSSGLSKSLSYGSGDRNANANRFQYSRPHCLSDRNSVGYKHPLQQSPISGCFRRQCRFQQYWNDRRLCNWRCSPRCRSNYSCFLPYSEPSSPHRISSSLPNSSNNHEHSPCLLPGRSRGGSSYHDRSPADIFGSSH